MGVENTVYASAVSHLSRDGIIAELKLWKVRHDPITDSILKLRRLLKRTYELDPERMG